MGCGFAASDPGVARSSRSTRHKPGSSYSNHGPQPHLPHYRTPSSTVRERRVSTVIKNAMGHDPGAPDHNYENSPLCEQPVTDPRRNTTSTSSGGDGSDGRSSVTNVGFAPDTEVYMPSLMAYEPHPVAYRPPLAAYMSPLVRHPSCFLPFHPCQLTTPQDEGSGFHDLYPFGQTMDATAATPWNCEIPFRAQRILPLQLFPLMLKVRRTSRVFASCSILCVARSQYRLVCPTNSKSATRNCERQQPRFVSHR